MAAFTKTPAGLLSLPCELRLEIYNYLIEPSDVALLPLPSMPELPTVTSQPALSLVCSQLREETLDVYFQVNTFVLRLFDLKDVRKIGQYLGIMGQERVQKIRHVAACCAAKLPFGHMLMNWWWRVDINLVSTELSWDRVSTWPEEMRLRDSFRKSFDGIVKARAKPSWTAGDLVEMMSIFNLTCTVY